MSGPARGSKACRLKGAAALACRHLPERSVKGAQSSLDPTCEGEGCSQNGGHSASSPTSSSTSAPPSLPPPAGGHTVAAIAFNCRRQVIWDGQREPGQLRRGAGNQLRAGWRRRPAVAS